MHNNLLEYIETDFPNPYSIYLHVTHYG